MQTQFQNSQTRGKEKWEDEQGCIFKFLTKKVKFDKNKKKKQEIKIPPRKRRKNEIPPSEKLI